MSIDVDAVCHVCSERIHLGQMFSSGWSFGYGTGDVAEQKRAGEWIMKHINHDIVIDTSDDVNPNYSSPLRPL